MTLAATAKHFTLLTKPGIIFGNVVTATAGFGVASQGEFDPLLFLATMLGLSLLIASACVFNNYIDQEADKKMERTQNRPLPLGVISGKEAVVFATLLAVAGAVSLALFSHPWSFCIAALAFALYVALYSTMKYRSTHATLVGSIAGAAAPVVGYVAVSHRLDAGSAILFLMLVLWQMPHFFSIAIYRLKDYTAASIPVLPLQKGIAATKVQMILYIAAFTVAASQLTLWHYVGPLFLLAALPLGGGWLWLGWRGLARRDHPRWAREMFTASLVVIMGISAAMWLTV